MTDTLISPPPVAVDADPVIDYSAGQGFFLTLNNEDFAALAATAWRNVEHGAQVGSFWYRLHWAIEDFLAEHGATVGKALNGADLTQEHGSPRPDTNATVKRGGAPHSLPLVLVGQGDFARPWPAGTGSAGA